MKKFSLILEERKKEIKETELIQERNLYLEFSKRYNKEHGVSGPFDKKFKGDKKAQSDYMEGLGMAWDEYKKKKGIKNKPKKKYESKIYENKASEMSSQMIGDGGDPNYHFVSMCDDYIFEKDGKLIRYSENIESSPLKIKTTNDFGSYTFGPFLNLEESKMFAESLELDELNGPRMVTISDRKNGEVFSKYLTCKLQPVWDESSSEKNSSENHGNDEDNEEDSNSEYTYRDENEEE
jgi:hypothetical protein